MASTVLRKDYSGAGNKQKQTISVWVKRCNGLTGNQAIFSVRHTGNSNFYGYLRFKTDSSLQFYNNSPSINVRTTRLFKDINAWYHIVITVDTTQSTAADRIKMYINGVQETSFQNSDYPSQNAEVTFGDDYRHEIGSYDSSYYFEGLMSHFYFITNTAYQASTFGSTDSTTGEWKINTSPTITYATNSFFILKDGNSVTDQSGQGNNFTVAGGTLTKTEDNPSNVFCTNNPLWKQESTRYLTHTRGNTMISGGGSATWYQTPGTLAFNSGKFYWECKYNAATNLTQNHAGVIVYEKTQESGKFRDKVGSVFFTNEDGGEMHIDGPATTADYGTIGQNDILGVAVDMDATTPTVKFYKNGSLHASTNAASLAGKFVTPAQMIYQSGEFQLNFGNGYFSTTAVSSAGTNASGIGIFEYDVPTGFTALTTKGLNL